MAVTRARRPLIWVMPVTPEITTESPTTKVCEPTVMTALLALLIAVMVRDLFAARVMRPVVVSTDHCPAGSSWPPTAIATLPGTGLKMIRFGRPMLARAVLSRPYSFSN
ncbi:hypothetical protein D3C81_1741590 [compost metagenome]